MEFYKMFNKRKIKSVHMIGIGGMGMSSLAFFLKLNNIEVSGSDIGQDPIIKKLKKIGCTIYGLHSSENIKNPDLIIYSSAIKENNPELIKAKKNKINILKRGKALGLFTNKMKNILLILALIVSTYTQCQELVWQSYNEEILYSTIKEPSRAISFYSDGSIITKGIEYDHLKQYGLSLIHI